VPPTGFYQYFTSFHVLPSFRQSSSIDLFQILLFIPLTTDWTTGIRSPAEANDFSSSLCVQTSTEAHPASCTIFSVAPFPGGRSRPACDADQSPGPTVEVKNEWDL
jgi:hypothetical protein